MGILFDRCLDNWAAQQRQTKGKRCIEILKVTEEHLVEMQSKYKRELSQIESAIAEGKNMSTATAYEKQARKTHLLELLKKRKTIRHYLSVAQRRNQQVLHKMLAVEALEVNQMQIDALKTTAKAFQAFSKKNGVEDLSSLEKASDTIADHMDALSDIDSIMQESGKLPLSYEDEDDEDLMKELEEYEMQDESSGNARQPDYSSMAMPEAPRGNLAAITEEQTADQTEEQTVEKTLEQPVVIEMNAV